MDDFRIQSAKQRGAAWDGTHRRFSGYLPRTEFLPDEVHQLRINLFRMCPGDAVWPIRDDHEPGPL